jgi:ribosomal protein S27E
MFGGTTLADLLKLKGCLQIKCHGCRRETLLFPADLADRMPLTTAVSEVTPRLRCTECGSTNVSAYEAYR